MQIHSLSQFKRKELALKRLCYIKRNDRNTLPAEFMDIRFSMNYIWLYLRDGPLPIPPHRLKKRR